MRISTDIADLEGTDGQWVRELSQIPMFYGRLVYLAGLRNPDNGRYGHSNAVSNNPKSLMISRDLKRIHEAVFRDWIGLSLERKKADIELYIAHIEPDERRALIDSWLRLTHYKNLVPATVQGPERQRHFSDFEAILGLLKNLYGVASPNPGA